MIIIYLILIYTLLGSIVKLLAQNEDIEKLTYYKMLIYFISNIIFMPIIILIKILDTIIPTLKQKRTIRYIKKQYNRQLMNDNLTEEQRQEIIHKRDAMVEFISNIGGETDYDEE
jgi:hypothetical protein